MENTNQDRPVTVVVVDDRVVPRMAARAMLADADDFQFVGEAAGAKEALSAIPRLRPDLVLLDVEMPEMDGAALAKRLVQDVPTAKLLAWTVSEAGDDLVRMLRAGCTGYVLKDTGPQEMLRALRAAMRDDSPIPRRMVPEVLRRLQARPQSDLDIHLTRREEDVLQLLAKGAPRKQIATMLGIAINSVDTHMKAIYRKLDVSSQTEAVNAALRSGLIDIEEL